MLDTESIDDWAQQNEMSLGHAIKEIVKYLLDDPTDLTYNVRITLERASDQEVREAMDAITDDLQNNERQIV